MQTGMGSSSSSVVIATVLIPLPDHDFDVTEVAVPWRLLTRLGHVVRFATEHGGTAPAADQRLLDGVIFGQLGAAAEPKAFYAEMQSDDEFRAPIAWADVEPDEFDGLILPGGHAPGMRQYLGSELLRAQGRRVLGARAGRSARSVTACWSSPERAIRRPDAVCCTGDGRRACRSTWSAPRSSRPRGDSGATTAPIPRTSRTRSAPRSATPPTSCAARACCPSAVPTTDDAPAFVVEDDNYVSARWPGDAYLFAKRFAAQLRN